jgi:hypothetical protein
MTVAARFPSPAEVEANTPATRDRAIDVIRIVSLVGVVVGHTIMATSTLRGGVFIWSNLLTARQPREIPAATVYSTPAPGVATTISVVSRNSGVTD